MHELDLILKGWRKLKRHRLLRCISLPLAVLAIVLIVLGNLVENNVIFRRFDHRHAARIQKIFLEKERILGHYAEALAECTLATNCDSAIVAFHQRYKDAANKQGLSLFIYRRDVLFYWTTHDVPIPQMYNPDDYVIPFIKFGKGFKDASPGRYAAFVYPCGEWTIVGLILVKNVYVPENEYLVSAFQSDFGLPPMVKISTDLLPGYEPIYDSSGNFVWSLVFDSNCSYRFQTIVPTILYLLALLAIFCIIDYFIKSQRHARRRNLMFFPLFLVLLAGRTIIYYTRRPSIMAGLDLFQATHFGSVMFPSLGNQILTTLFIAFFVIEFYKHFQFPLFWQRRTSYFTCIFVLLTVVATMLIFSEVMLETLVINSSDMFESPGRYLIFNKYTLAGYISMGMLLFSFCLLLDKAVAFCTREMRMKQLLIVCIIGACFGLLIMLPLGCTFNPVTIVVLAAAFVISGVKHLHYGGRFRYSHVVLLALTLSIFFSINLHKFSTMKYRDQKQVLVTNLATPHDFDAEHRLRGISDRIIAATLLTKLMYTRSDSDVREYVWRTYFQSSFWASYTCSAVSCDAGDALLLGNGMGRDPSCIGYFSNLLTKYGAQLPHSQFFYLNRPQNDNVATYMGWFLKERPGLPALHLFFELWTGDGSEDLGYPELLLDGKRGRDDKMNGYTYARYHNNRRVYQSGGFTYPLSANEFMLPSNNVGEYYYIETEQMEHIVYRSDANTLIVLSSRSSTLWNMLINFSYIFIFTFLLVSFFSLFFLPIRHNFGKSLRNRIQFSMILIVIVSFGILAVYTFFYINKQYSIRHRDLLNAKMQSISRELQTFILWRQKMDASDALARGLRPNFSPHDWLNDHKNELLDELIHLRNLFMTDVNIYDVYGHLVATSLPEVFEHRLTGRQMSPDAFISLNFHKNIFAMNTEKIGSLDYLSSYEAIVDDNNNFIAFINLPYFTQQDELREEISGLVAAITNFYVIIIFLTVLMSVIIGKQITHPLNLLQEKFKNIKLGANNEPIRYYRDDEIGGLVKEYNRAIAELARSAAQLARSERESAWRDMAKQIAHEINNPLTPMKLSVQHLKRAWDNKSERFGEYMEKISHSLVEQIDTLSTIATEFSNFAKMPTVNNQPMDVLQRINDVVPLFATGDNKRAFTTNFHGLEKAMIFADKEQISRVFINLIKNALQAIPKDREPEIKIDVLIVNRAVWIRIKDNGPGIPKDMQDKIFKPNFTTKSSGMGIGLAIVRNTIEGSGGTISFQTKPDEGTTFIISLPELV